MGRSRGIVVGLGVVLCACGGNVADSYDAGGSDASTLHDQEGGPSRFDSGAPDASEQPDSTVGAKLAYVFGETASDTNASTAGASFFADPQPDPTCVFMRAPNTCSVAVCTAGANSQSLNAGDFDAVDGPSSVQFAFDPGSGTYSAAAPFGPVFAAPSTLVISGGGGPALSESFMVSLPFPSGTSLVSPMLTNDLVLDSTQDLPLSWLPIADEVLFVIVANVQTTGNTAILTCYSDGPAGSSVVPHEALTSLAQAAPQSLAIVAQLFSLERFKSVIGGWTIETLALGPGGPSGQVQLQ